MQIEAPKNTNKVIERERKELYRLMENEASKEAIQSQSEKLDKHIVKFIQGRDQHGRH